MLHTTLRRFNEYTDTELEAVYLTFKELVANQDAVEPKDLRPLLEKSQLGVWPKAITRYHIDFDHVLQFFITRSEGKDFSPYIQDQLMFLCFYYEHKLNLLLRLRNKVAEDLPLEEFSQFKKLTCKQVANCLPNTFNYKNLSGKLRVTYLKWLKLRGEQQLYLDRDKTVRRHVQTLDINQYTKFKPYANDIPWFKFEEGKPRILMVGLTDIQSKWLKENKNCVTFQAIPIYNTTEHNDLMVLSMDRLYIYSTVVSSKKTRLIELRRGKHCKVVDSLYELERLLNGKEATD